MASLYQSSLVTKPSNMSNCVVAGFGLMLVVAVWSFNLSCIFFTSIFLIICTAYFTLFFRKYPTQCMPHLMKEEVVEIVSEHVSLSYFATCSENENIDYHDDHCMSMICEDDEDHGCGNAAKSLLFPNDIGFISDEEMLIEIELPTGNCLSPYKVDRDKQLKTTVKQISLQDYYSHQQSWMQLLSEEDSLIEIDISIGSIICPRFEIEAPMIC